jgi:hypothetical protein
LSKPAEVTDYSNETLAYYRICPFAVHYDFETF